MSSKLLDYKQNILEPKPAKGGGQIIPLASANPPRRKPLPIRIFDFS